MFGVGLASIMARKPFKFSISADAANVNLYDVAVLAGYSSGDCIIRVNSGVNLYSNLSGTPGVTRGSGWASGILLILINAGIIYGRGGNGGTDLGPVAGLIGGTALDSSSGAMTVSNLGSIIAGGGGGGAGGNNTGDGGNGFGPPYGAGGGGGGGGQGFIGGTGGLGYYSGGYYDGNNGYNGSNGALLGAGAGGAGGEVLGPTPTYGGAGGAGGAYGTAGTAGSDPSGYSSGPGSSGGAAGAAGYAIVGNSNITWSVNGVKTGQIG